MPSAISCRFEDRAARMTWAPSRARVSAKNLPKPREAPVTTAIRFVRRGLVYPPESASLASSAFPNSCIVSFPFGAGRVSQHIKLECYAHARPALWTSLSTPYEAPRFKLIDRATRHEVRHKLAREHQQGNPHPREGLHRRSEERRVG